MGKPDRALGPLAVVASLLILAACSGADTEEVLTSAEPWEQPPGTGIQIGNPYEVQGGLIDGGYRAFPPRAVSPPTDAVFYEVPRTTTLEWTAVSDTVDYEVEVDACDLSVVHPAVDCDNWTEEVRVTIRSTTHTFDFSKLGSGRWRVRAVAGDSATGYSAYRYLEYVR